MLTFKWSFKCFANDAIIAGIDAVLQGKVHEVARFACTKIVRRSTNFGVSHGTQPTAAFAINGFLETFMECTESTCRSILPGVTWSPVAESFTQQDADLIFCNHVHYDMYIHPELIGNDAEGSIYNLDQNGSFDFESESSNTSFTNDMAIEIHLDDSIDFASIEPMTFPNNDSESLSLSSGMPHKTRQTSFNTSFYNSTSMDQWRQNFVHVYANFVSSHSGVTDTEEALQKVIPKSYPLASSPLEFRRYHLQLAMFRGDFDQLLGQYLSFFLFAHPSSAWHQKTPTDEILLQYFVTPPSEFDLSENLSLSRLRLESPHAEYARFVLDKVIFASNGGVIQPFSRIWRSMVGKDYEPGDRPSSCNISNSFATNSGATASTAGIAAASCVWDCPIKQHNNSTQFGHLMNWTIDSNAWFRIASNQAWSVTGPVTTCFADFAEILTSLVIRIDGKAKRQVIAEAPLVLQRSMSRLRSSHLNMRCMHLLAASCHLIAHLNEIVSSSRFDISSAHWMIASLFNMMHFHELVQVSPQPNTVQMLQNTYHSPNMTMIFLELWRYSILLPTVLSMALGAKIVEANLPLMEESLNVQSFAKLLVFDNTRMLPFMPGQALPKVFVVDNHLKGQVRDWVESLIRFMPKLVATIMSPFETNQNIDIDDQSRSSSGTNLILQDQDYVTIIIAASAALSRIETMASL